MVSTAPPVLNPKKPKNGTLSSLNDYVYQGPDLANGLVGVLLQFRQGTVEFMADLSSSACYP